MKTSQMVYGPATLKTLVKHKHRAAIYYLNQKAQINSRQKNTSFPIHPKQQSTDSATSVPRELRYYS